MSSAAVPAADRFEWFADVIANELVPTELRDPPASGGFRAEAGALALDVLQLSTFECTPCQSRRTPAQVRQNDPERYQFSLLTGSPMWLEQNRNGTEVNPGDMVLLNTAHPNAAGALGEDRAIRNIVIQVPRSELPLPSDKTDRLVAQRISGETGMGAILAGFMRTLETHASECGPVERTRLGRVAVDLISAVLAERCDTYEDLPSESRTRILMERIDSFIDHNLGDPGLTPQLVADRHHISVRRLHQMFRDQEDGVAATIRRRRLERCHADLSRPELLTRPIGAIATRWGFGNPAVFSRAFREAYGMSPSERRAHTAAPAGRPE
ncbi:helix-turn-helix domain-containing protein [Streptomyces sp. NPDC059835]|uniref:AraC-like ligand-binding domain-containing protein n=1 Tax=Streptomyces sp. NPDC059835 TaxID=3346967 RepID=UPI0036672843